MYQLKFGDSIFTPQKENNFISVLSTGCKDFDKLTNVNGFPAGTLVEFAGKSSTGKTSFALSMIAHNQKLGKTCAIIDVANSFNPTYARGFGVDNGKLIVTSPESAEQIIYVIEELIAQNVDLIILDDLASVAFADELEKDFADPTLPTQLSSSRTDFLSSIYQKIVKTSSLLIFMNYVYPSFQDKTKYVSLGEYGVKMVSALRVFFSHKRMLQFGGKITGIKTNLEIIHNKYSSTSGNIDLNISFNGIVK